MSVFASLVHVHKVPDFLGECSYHKVLVHIEAAETVTIVTHESQMKDDGRIVNHSHQPTV